MQHTNFVPQAFGRLVLRGERVLLNGAAEALLLAAIALGSGLALVSLLAPAV
jgi:hypothetical protein